MDLQLKMEVWPCPEEILEAAPDAYFGGLKPFLESVKRLKEELWQAGEVQVLEQPLGSRHRGPVARFQPEIIQQIIMLLGGAGAAAGVYKLLNALGQTEKWPKDQARCARYGD
jgi:hypothetical protein